jgi:hypothetical protein
MSYFKDEAEKDSALVIAGSLLISFSMGALLTYCVVMA